VKHHGLDLQQTLTGREKPMAYELTGKIKLIQEPRTFDSGFTKRETIAAEIKTALRSLAEPGSQGKQPSER